MIPFTEWDDDKRQSVARSLWDIGYVLLEGGRFYNKDKESDDKVMGAFLREVAAALDPK